jgi:tetratricopeptide (TPR) repeat protein
MKHRSWMNNFFWILIILVLLMVCFSQPTKADIAPPEQPAGGNPAPDLETTQVRMVAETVLIEVISATPSGSLGKARVTASFTMQNLGTQDENLQVRFPLTSLYGSSAGSREIEDFKANVNGVPLQVRRIESDYDGLYDGPWAEFPIAFPAGKEVEIEVTYLVEGDGEYPFIALKYIFHTGAGWKGTIGTANLTVRLPYEANPQNVIFDTEIGWSTTTPGGILDGREIRWHLEDFEPDFSQNFSISLVMPIVWRAVLREQDTLAKNPKDGEAWGRLGKLYKECFLLRRGFREDAGGEELYRLSRAAYQQALILLPEDALWMAGYADLLWNHWYYSERFKASPDYAELTDALQLLQRSRQIDPQNEKATSLLDDIRYAVPEAVQEVNGEYVLLILTVTPTAAPSFTLTQVPTTTLVATATPEPTATLVPTLAQTYTLQPKLATLTPILPTQVISPTTMPTSKPKGPLTVCGVVLPVPLACFYWLRKVAHKKGSSVDKNQTS